MEAVCQDGRGFEWRRKTATDSPVTATRKTADADDDDEKDSEMTPNRYRGKPWAMLSWSFGPQENHARHIARCRVSGTGH
jgi:hypothetical protein